MTGGPLNVVSACYRRNRDKAIDIALRFHGSIKIRLGSRSPKAIARASGPASSRRPPSARLGKTGHSFLATRR
jgi:hypothetical protein